MHAVQERRAKGQRVHMRYEACRGDGAKGASREKRWAVHGFETCRERERYEERQLDGG